MDRRNFIKNCSLVLSGITVAKSIALQPKMLFGKDDSTKNIALNLITGNSEIAVEKVEALIKNSKLNLGTVKFAEYSIPGKHIGDIVLVRDNNLINFRAATDEFSRDLFKLAEELGLPEQVENPVLCKFYTEEKIQSPESVDIFHKNDLIHQLEVDDEKAAYDITGTKGYLTISIKNKNVRTIYSTCKHKTCIKMGSINKPGQNLVCIPNQIRVSISGDNEFGIDSLSF